MNTKTIATIAVFSALTIALNLSPFKIPAPFAPFLIYQIWEIPIIAAFLLFGPSMGAGIAVINTVALLALFPGELPTGPFYNLAAVLGMFVGVYGAHCFMARYSGVRREALLVIASTGLGVVSRVAIMSIANWAFLRYPPPVGFSMTEESLTLMLPIVGFFNATLALYVIPIGHVLARAVGVGIKTGMWNPRPERD